MFTSATSPASASGPDGGLARELSSAKARLESQERQIQELNHRVANSLQLAADMLTFEQLRARDPFAQAALEASRARLVAVGELHRYLYDHADRPSVELQAVPHRPLPGGLRDHGPQLRRRRRRHRR
jgi:two-component sensor histidine kinase